MKMLLICRQICTSLLIDLVAVRVSSDDKNLGRYLPNHLIPSQCLAIKFAIITYIQIRHAMSSNFQLAR